MKTANRKQRTQRSCIRTLFLLPCCILACVCALTWGCLHDILHANNQEHSNVNHVLTQHIHQGTLPESFVSIGIKNHDGVYQHLVGGFLIHPGVVLTSWRYARKHYSAAIRQNFQAKKYIQFHIQQGPHTKTMLFEAQDEVQQSNPHHNEPTPDPDVTTLADLSLLFFHPQPAIDHIQPLPLATTDDISFLREASNHNMWTVGVKGYQGPLPPSACPRQPASPTSFSSSLGQVHFAFTPEEYAWITLLIKAFPGKLQPYIDDNFNNSLTLTIQPSHQPDHTKLFCSPLGFCVQPLSAFQDILNLRVLTECSTLGFCTQPIVPPSRSHPNATALQFQCVEHTGYPVLWQSPSGVWKALGITVKVPYSYQVSNNFKKNRVNVQTLIQWPQTLRSVHYDLVTAHHWIHQSLKAYSLQDHHPFSAQEAILNRLDGFARTSLTEREELDFIVTLSRKKDQQSSRNFCVGSLIEPHIVLTAAHCVEEDGADNPPRSLFVIKRITGKEYAVAVNRVIPHPRWQKSHPARDKADTVNTVDLAVLFLEKEQPIPTSPPRLHLKSHPHKDLSNTKATTTELWSIANAERPHTPQSQSGYQFRPYRLFRLQTVTNLSSYLSQTMSAFSENPQKYQMMISAAEDMSYASIQQQDVLSKIIALPQRILATESFYYLKLKHCLNNTYVCFHPYKSRHRLEQYRTLCRGNSGAPVMTKSSSHGPYRLVGVLVRLHAQHSHTSYFGYSSQGIFIELTPYKNWLQSLISHHKQASE